jgi:hypothetical protein
MRSSNASFQFPCDQAPVVDKKAMKQVKLNLDMFLNSVPNQDKLTQTTVQLANPKRSSRRTGAVDDVVADARGAV